MGGARLPSPSGSGSARGSSFARINSQGSSKKTLHSSGLRRLKLTEPELSTSNMQLYQYSIMAGLAIFMVIMSATTGQHTELYLAINHDQFYLSDMESDESIHCVCVCFQPVQKDPAAAPGSPLRKSKCQF